MVKKHILFVVCAVAFSSAVSANPLRNAGQHLRRHALKYAGGAVATVTVAEEVHDVASIKYDAAKEKMPDLFAVRLQWNGQEFRIGRLRRLAEKKIASKVCKFYSEREQFSTDIDANKQTITTFFNGKRAPIELSYRQFDEIFREYPTVDLVNGQLKKQYSSILLWSKLMAVSRPFALVTQFQEKVQPSILSTYAKVKASAIKAFDTWAKKNS